MVLSQKTLEQLRILINEVTEYRTGSKLVAFFNNLGYNDSYGQGFPSRGTYTDSRLSPLNGTPELDKCIKRVFEPVNFIGRFDVLDKLIEEFNQFLSFDGWIVVRTGKEITFKKVDDSYFIKKEEVKKEQHNQSSESDFLSVKYDEITLDGLDVDAFVFSVIETRVNEFYKCLDANASLSVVFHCGSILEGVLLGLAQKNARQFNSSRCAPMKESKIKPYHEWTLLNFIDTAHNLGYLKEDVKQFSHVLRDFRNYIHPYQQASTSFMPDEYTAKICFHVLKAAVAQIKIGIKNKTI